MPSKRYVIRLGLQSHRISVEVAIQRIAVHLGETSFDCHQPRTACIQRPTGHRLTALRNPQLFARSALRSLREARREVSYLFITSTYLTVVAQDSVLAPTAHLIVPQALAPHRAGYGH